MPVSRCLLWNPSCRVRRGRWSRPVKRPGWRWSQCRSGWWLTSSIPPQRGNYKLSPTLKPLAKYRNEFTAFSNFDHGVRGGHAANHALLSGVLSTERAGYPDGNLSIDQRAAELVGHNQAGRRHAHAGYHADSVWLKFSNAYAPAHGHDGQLHAFFNRSQGTLTDWSKPKAHCFQCQHSVWQNATGGVNGPTTRSCMMLRWRCNASWSGRMKRRWPDVVKAADPNYITAHFGARGWAMSGWKQSATMSRTSLSPISVTRTAPGEFSWRLHQHQEPHAKLREPDYPVYPKRFEVYVMRISAPAWPPQSHRYVASRIYPITVVSPSRNVSGSLKVGVLKRSVRFCQRTKRTVASALPFLMLCRWYRTTHPVAQVYWIIRHRLAPFLFSLEHHAG